MHVELLMKTQTGWKNIGKLYATCKPGYHINMKMTMFSKEDVNRVQGQLGVVHHSEYRRGGGAGLLETDQESSAYRPRVPASQRLLDFCVSSMFFRVFLGVNPPFPGTVTGQLHDFFGPRFLYEDISPQDGDVLQKARLW